MLPRRPPFWVPASLLGFDSGEKSNPRAANSIQGTLVRWRRMRGDEVGFADGDFSSPISETQQIGNRRAFLASHRRLKERPEGRFVNIHSIRCGAATRSASRSNAAARDEVRRHSAFWPRCRRHAESAVRAGLTWTGSMCTSLTNTSIPRSRSAGQLRPAARSCCDCSRCLVVF